MLLLVSSVLLVLLIRVVSKDVYFTSNLRQGLRITQLNHTYQVCSSYRLYRKNSSMDTPHMHVTVRIIPHPCTHHAAVEHAWWLPVRDDARCSGIT